MSFPKSFKSMLFSSAVVGLVLMQAEKSEARHHDSQLAIDGIVAAGSGCEAKELVEGVDFQIWHDRWLVIQQGSGMTAQSGPEVPLREFRKNCSYNIRFAGNDDVSVAIGEVITLNRANLGQGVSGAAVVAAHVQAGRVTDTSTLEFTGRLNGTSFLWHELEGIATSCGLEESLTLNSQVRLSPSQARSQNSSFSQYGLLYIELLKEQC